MKMTGAEMAVEILLEHNVDTIFGYPGGAALFIYDALYKYKDKIRHVLTAHEQGASHAADGYARSTGKTGVVLATADREQQQKSGHRNSDGVYGQHSYGHYYCKCCKQPDRPRCVSGNLHNRYHIPCYQTQLLCKQDRRAGRRPQKCLQNSK